MAPVSSGSCLCWNNVSCYGWPTCAKLAQRNYCIEIIWVTGRDQLRTKFQGRSCDMLFEGWSARVRRAKLVSYSLSEYIT